MKEYWFPENDRDGYYTDGCTDRLTCKCVHEFYFSGQTGAINHRRYEIQHDEDCNNCAGRGIPPISWSDVK